MVVFGPFVTKRTQAAFGSTRRTIRWSDPVAGARGPVVPLWCPALLSLRSRQTIGLGLLSSLLPRIRAIELDDLADGHEPAQDRPGDDGIVERFVPVFGVELGRDL